ncbi:hypothetical protein GCM10017750_02580 [Streptomyces racemochromogenes]
MRPALRALGRRQAARAECDVRCPPGPRGETRSAPPGNRKSRARMRGGGFFTLMAVAGLEAADTADTLILPHRP